MPVYNTDERWLRAAIESIRNQLYPDWELCGRRRIDGPEGRGGAAAVSVAGLRDQGRLPHGERPHFGGVEQRPELATGEFIALVDHDDVLPRHARLQWCTS